MDETTAYSLFESGNAKFKSGIYNGAIRDYSKAIKISNLNCELGAPLLSNLNGRLGAPLFSTFTTAHIYYKRGIAKSKLKLYESAIEDYSSAIDQKPNFETTAYLHRGNAKFSLYNFPGAFDDYKYVLEHTSLNSPEFLLNLGMCYYQLGDRHEAYICWIEAEALNLASATHWNEQYLDFASLKFPYIFNLTHFLDENGNIPKEMTREGKGMAGFLALIVDSATKEYPPADNYSQIRCLKMKCPGLIEIEVDTRNEFIYWKCNKCSEAGTISDWGKTKWDNR